MNTITTLREEVRKANTERLDRTTCDVARDLQYLVGCGTVELEGGSIRKVGLELWLKEPRLLEHIGLADYLIHDAREEQRLCLTDKGEQLFRRLEEEGFYREQGI